MTTSDPVIVEVTVAAPAPAVWRALREPAEIRRWFGWDYPGLDDEIGGIFVSGASVSESDRTIDTGEGRFVLEPRGEHTVVRVTRAAPAGSTSWNGIYDGINEGWMTFAQQLRFALERHPGEERRTVRLTGESAPTIDLADIESVPVGERYEITISPDEETPAGEQRQTSIPPSETLAGEVWFRSKHQTGLTVDRYGDGLLVVTEAEALISTYGLDDTTFDRIRDRWTS
jgi:uncharacterized protein YndB with AHSA1/START domain